MGWRSIQAVMLGLHRVDTAIPGQVTGSTAPVVSIPCPMSLSLGPGFRSLWAREGVGSGV